MHVLPVVLMGTEPAAMPDLASLGRLRLDGGAPETVKESIVSGQDPIGPLSLGCRCTVGQDNHTYSHLAIAISVARPLLPSGVGGKYRLLLLYKYPDCIIVDGPVGRT
ncbi:hypothetical protein NDU88_004379 [Pleurodeles waltl]|uniref:Uncharacterized protein n=1 Tax=Pleurodeles waltl TaxID=8319 RepID=A0AAV7LJN2_PLEWA|nr:hypothetical protein NDU88_004379 [Pleurodeles waltl]